MLSEFQNAPKYSFLKAFPIIFVWRDSCLWQVAQGFPLSHLDYPSDAQQWRTQLVCLFWDWLLLESKHDSLLISILFRFRRDKYTLWNLLVTVHCLAMQDSIFFLNVFELHEGTGISEDSSGSSNIETFFFCPPPFARTDIHLSIGQNGPLANCFIISTDQYLASSDSFFLHSSISWSQWTAPSSCRLTFWLCRSNRVMNFDTWEQEGSLDSCVPMSIHCLCSIGVKPQPLVDDGFSTGLVFAAGFPEAFSSSWIGMASLANLSIPFTIPIQDSVWSLNRDWTWTSILYIFRIYC